MRRLAMQGPAVLVNPATLMSPVPLLPPVMQSQQARLRPAAQNASAPTAPAALANPAAQMAATVLHSLPARGAGPT